MSVDLTYFLSGWKQMTVSACGAAGLLEVCRRCGIPYDGFLSHPDGRLSLTLRGRQARRLTAACAACGIPVSVTASGGLPVLLRRFLRRPGLVAGFLLGTALLILSEQYVWDIRVSGTDTLCARDVKEDLAACGFAVGSPLRGFHADVTENRVLLHDPRLAWISINRRGTVAYVEVREALRPSDPEPTGPSNLVAAAGGRIERIELLDGNLLVSAGQEVSEGQLLVSGLYDSETAGVRWTRARARVYARTAETFLIEIPLSCEAVTVLPPGGDGNPLPTHENSLIFFGKTIKFSKNTGNEGVVCDTIIEEKNLSPRPGVGFPIALCTTWYLPVRTVTMTRTPKEAEALAYLELSRRIAALPGGAELLSETLTPELTDSVFRLEVFIICVRDIAREVPVEIGN